MLAAHLQRPIFLKRPAGKLLCGAGVMLVLMPRRQLEHSLAVPTGQLQADAAACLVFPHLFLLLPLSLPLPLTPIPLSRGKFDEEAPQFGPAAPDAGMDTGADAALR